MIAHKPNESTKRIPPQLITTQGERIDLFFTDLAVAADVMLLPRRDSFVPREQLFAPPHAIVHVP